MRPKNRQRRFSLMLLFVIGAIMISTVAVFGFIVNFRATDRSSPRSVHDRTMRALSSNNLSALYEELSPEMKELFPPESLTSFQSTATGPVTINLLKAPQIRTESPWNGEWADATVQISHDNIVEDYLVRYHLEQGRWWLYATLKLQ